MAQLSKRLLLFTAIAVALVTRASAQLPVLVFEPGFEGEIWQRLPQLGKRIGPQCVPQWLLDPDEGTYFPNPDIQGDNPETWDPNNPPAEVLNDHPTGVLCDSAVDTIPLDEFLFPYDVAVWQAPGEPATIDPATGFPMGYRIFVSDSNNNRVVAFGPDGPDADDNPDPVTTLPNADWTGRPSAALCSTAPDGSDCSATMLVPDGIDVDDAGNVWVADSGNNRILVFDNNGVWQATYFGDGEMYGLDVAPGSAYGEAGGRVAFISIESGIYTSLTVIDTGDLSEVGRFTTGPSSVPNELNISTDVAYHVDDLGTVRLAVADWTNSAIKVFQTDGSGAPVQTLDLLFGPTPINSDPDSQLQQPYRLSVDGRGRFLVSDTANQRLAVFKPDFTTNPTSPTVSYLFQLNAAGGLNGFPRGIVEDRIGRLIVADLANHKVEIFQIPDLAVINATLDEELIEIDSEATVSFSVTVPETKHEVVEVVPVCQVSGPATMVTTEPVLVGAPLGTPGGTTRPTIHDREIFRYSCTARATGAGELVFTVGAVGNPGGITVAPTKTVTARVRCADCESTPPTIDSTVVIPPSPTPNAAGWYQGAVTVRLLAADIQAGDSGIQRVFWRWTGPMAATFVPCVPGADYSCVTITPSQPSADVDVLVSIQGTSTIEYWTADVAFNQSAHGTRQIRLDHEAPNTSATVTGGGMTPPTVSFNSNDPISGVAAIYYSVSVGGIVVIPATVVPPSNQVLVNVAGAMTFSFWAIDVAGNIEEAHSIDLAFANGAPVAGNDAFSGVEDQAVSGVVGGNDSDPEGTALTFALVSPPAAGTISFTSSTGAFTYTPPANVCGPITFTYRANDGTSNSNVATVTLNIACVNDPPIAVNKAYTVNAGSVLTVAAPGLLAGASDPDAGDAISVTAVSAPSHGTVTAFGANGTFSYTPTAGYTGTDTFTFTVSDNHGASVTRTVTITISAVNQTPILGLVKSVNKTTAAPGDLLVYTLTYANTGQGAVVNVTIADEVPGGTTFQSATGGGTLAGGTVTWTVASLAAGTSASVTMTVKVNTSATSVINVATIKSTQTQTKKTSNTVTTTVLRANRPPTVSLSNRTDTKGTTVSVQTAGSDLDGDTLTYSATGLPSGTSMNSTGRITGTLTTAGTYTVTVTVKDPSNATDTGTFVWTVTNPNRPPDALNDSATTVTGSVKTISVLSNDVDADGHSLTVVSVTQPSKGTVTLNSNGTIKYTPPSSFTGTTTFTYQVSDGKGGTDSATVTVTVRAHYDNDDCDHDRDRNSHRDGDNCDHDRSNHRDDDDHDRNDDDHDRKRKGHRDGDGCSTERYRRR